MLQVTQGPESALLHLNNVAVLKVKMGEVGGEEERTPGQLSQVVLSQVKFHCNLNQFNQKDLKTPYQADFMMEKS